MATNLPPLPLQLRRAQQHADESGGQLCWVLFDQQNGRCLSEPHPATGATTTLAWANKAEAKAYQRRMGLNLWRVWPVNTTLLAQGAAEDSQRTGQKHTWAWKRDSRPPRVALDQINPWTGEIQRVGWGRTVIWADPVCEPDPYWEMHQLATLFGLALLEECR